jgi:predicted phage-related endonuclease
MDNSSELLKSYSEFSKLYHEVKHELSELEKQIEAHVRMHGEVSDFGFVAQMKPGRKSTNHKAAATEAKVSEEVIDMFTKTKTTTSWAKVTDLGKVSKEILEKHTTQSPATFVIKGV